MPFKKKKLPQSKEHPPLHEQRRAASRCGGDAYIRVKSDFVRVFGPKKAILIGIYVNKFLYTSDRYPENNGWWWCTTEDIQKVSPTYTRQYIANLRNELKEMGMLETQRFGFDPTVWNWIDFDKLNAYAEAEMNKIESNEQPSPVADQQSPIAENDTIVTLRNYTAATLRNYTAATLRNYTSNTLANNTNINIIPSTNVLCGSDEPPNLLSNDPLDIISYWNTLPNVTKHKLDPSSKTIQSACKMLSALLQGIPMVNTKGNQPRKEMRTFFQSYKIDQVYLRKKWSVQEIKNHLLSAVTIKNGQMNTKISLPVLLWNEFASKDSNGNKTAFSWFFYALAVDCTPQAFIDMATSLAKSVNGKNHPILKWANELYRFSLAEEMTPPPMAALLRWYLLNKDQSFMPMVRDMDEFIRKYRQIEDNRSHRRKNGGRSRLHVDEPVEFYDCKGNLIPSEQSGKINVDELEFYDGKGNLIPKDSAR